MKIINSSIFFFFLVAGTLVFLAWNSRRKMLTLDKFAKGTVVGTYVTSKRVVNYIYEFNINGKKNEGFNRDWDLSKRSKVINKEYVVGYNSLNPDKNHMFFELPIASEKMLDSLNNCCSPQDYIDLWTSINK